MHGSGGKDAALAVVISTLPRFEASIQRVDMNTRTISVLGRWILIAFCLVVSAFAQNSPGKQGYTSVLERETKDTASDTGAWTPEQITTMGRLRDAALKDPYAYQTLTYLSDSIGPRLTGSPQAAAAVDWVAAEMRALGAEVTLEKTTVPRWVRGQEAGALTSWPGMTPSSTQKIVLTALGNSAATPPQGITAPIIVVQSFAELQRLPRDAVRGRIVLFNRSFNEELSAEGQGLSAYIQNAPYRLLGASAAAAMGAAAMLVRSVGGGNSRTPHTGNLLYTDAGRQIPAAAVASEDAELLARLTSRGPVTMHLVLTPQSLPPVTSYNVIADWKGSEYPDQVVVVSGHLDSWDLGTGAADDGCGVVTAMEAIQLLESFQLHPRRTIRMIAWMNEENNATGAETYAHDHAGDWSRHIAAMESDTGCDHPFGLYVAGSPAFESYLAPAARVLEPMGSGIVSSPKDLPTEDIGPMVKAGVPGLTPANDMRFYFNYHHTAADTLDKINRDRLAENAAVVAVAAYALADAGIPAPRRR